MTTWPSIYAAWWEFSALNNVDITSKAPDQTAFDLVVNDHFSWVAVVDLVSTADAEYAWKWNGIGRGWYGRSTVANTVMHYQGAAGQGEPLIAGPPPTGEKLLIAGVLENIGPDTYDCYGYRISVSGGTETDSDLGRLLGGVTTFTDFHLWGHPADNRNLDGKAYNFSIWKGTALSQAQCEQIFTEAIHPTDVPNLFFMWDGWRVPSPEYDPEYPEDSVSYLLDVSAPPIGYSGPPPTPTPPTPPSPELPHADPSPWPPDSIIIWVSKEGSDTTGTGSQQEPYLTIERAFLDFTAGDQIRILDGTYTPADTIVFDGVPGSLFAENPNEVTIQPQRTSQYGTALAILNSDRFTVQGINILQSTETQTATSVVNNVGLYANNVENFHAYTCSISGFDCPSGCAGIWASGTGRIENCTVSDLAIDNGNLYGIYANGMSILDNEITELIDRGSSGVYGMYAIDDYTPPGPPTPPTPPVYPPFDGHHSLVVDLWAYYSLDAPDGADSTGKHDAVPTGAPVSVPGKHNNAIDFTIANNYFDIGETGADAAWSVSCWLYMPSTRGWAGTGVVLSSVAHGYTSYVDTNGNPGMYVGGASPWQTHVTSLGTDAWKHVVYSQTTGGFYVVIDGDWAGRLSGVAPGKTMGPDNLGADGNGFNGLRCYGDEVGIWSRVLTQAEVEELYNAGAGLFYS